jgi:hypothetical protein
VALAEGEAKSLVAQLSTSLTIETANRMSCHGRDHGPLSYGAGHPVP